MIVRSVLEFFALLIDNKTAKFFYKSLKMHNFELNWLKNKAMFQTLLQNPPIQVAGFAVITDGLG